MAVPFLLLIAETVATFPLWVTRTSDCLVWVTTTTRDGLSEQVARKSLEYFVQNCRIICSKITEKLHPKSSNWFQNRRRTCSKSPKNFIQNRWKTSSITAKNLLKNSLKTCSKIARKLARSCKRITPKWLKTCYKSAEKEIEKTRTRSTDARRITLAFNRCTELLTAVVRLF